MDLKWDGFITGGVCWSVNTEKRLSDKKALENFGYKVYSQNDEDGIINEIFKRIGVTTKEFIEFGVQNGLESNCHFLLHKGWKGLWIEGDNEYCKEINLRFRPVIKHDILRVVNAFITEKNINTIIKKKAFSTSPDFLSIDIDGNDWYIWKKISIVSPRVVCIEYNGKFPPDVEWVQPYNPKHIWYGSDWQGASLKSIEILGKSKGYQLVATNLNGVNAFFVRNDCINDLFMKMDTAEELYNPLRKDLMFNAPGHDSEFCLARQNDFICESQYFSSTKKYSNYYKKRKNKNSFINRCLRKVFRR
ncbi:MAG: hypothetical protein J6M24_04445 [Lachnospiraceae bacterium]|nr:hypothetical protein [Lachnospiraceae bacterium]